MFSFLQCRMGISERSQSWFLQIRYKCTMLNMPCGCAGYMPGRAVRKKGRPQRPFCIPRLHPRWLGGISRWGIPFSKQAASCGPRLPPAVVRLTINFGTGRITLVFPRRTWRLVNIGISALFLACGFPSGGLAAFPGGGRSAFSSKIPDAQDGHVVRGGVAVNMNGHVIKHMPEHGGRLP